MKKLFLILFSFIETYSLHSQTNYFNNNYNPNNTWSIGVNMYPVNNGYICSGLGRDSILNKKNIMLTKLDSAGNRTYYKEYKLDTSNYYIGSGGGGLSKCQNGGYILGGGIVNHFYSIYLYRLDDNFDTIWTKIIYKDTIFSAITQCIETSDKGFALCGEKEVVSPSCSVVILYKTDSLGNLKWEKTYNISGYNGDQWDKAWNVTETPDKGFLLGCYTYSVPTMGFYQGSGDGVVIKTDSMGNAQWIKNVGSPLMDATATTRVCQDGNFLIATIYSYFTAEYNDYSKSKLRLIKVTPADSVIWDKQYEPVITSLSAIKVMELDNGDIVIGGTKWFQYISEYGYYNSYLFKLNVNGESIWYREYAKVTDTIPLTWNTLNNFEQTPDGGFVGCGELLVSGQIAQSIWVFKTDSLGCLQPGCQYVGVEELHKAKGELQIFPNPATIQTTITYPITEKGIMLQIYNMLGQMVYEEKLSNSSSQTILDTRAYKKGLYKVVAGESSATLIIMN